MGTVLFIIALIVVISMARKNKSLQEELKNAKDIAGQITDVNSYCADKRKEADEYSEERRCEADSRYQVQQQSIEQMKKAVDRLKAEEKQLKSELDALEKDVIVGMVSIEPYEGLKSDEIKNQLSILKSKQDQMIKDEKALKIFDKGMTKSALNSQKKQILRCFNAECSNIIQNVTVKNVDTSRSKIQKAFDAINKIFAVDGVELSHDFLETKFEELSLLYACMVKEEEERETRKAIREQMVEEEKVRREIEKAKQKIEKEETQFSNEIKKLMSYMQKAGDDVEKNLYLDKIKELEEKLKAVQADKENVMQREQNTRAGFVYIISNIGSFGENVFKIGMTRRLEPMDRIAELSSASVPFPFDVHALIFSEDAPGLETILHQHFDAKRVNKVNPRKEFFKVNLDEIKDVVLKNHNATVRFVDIPDAEEYRQTQKMEA